MVYLDKSNWSNSTCYRTLYGKYESSPVKQAGSTTSSLRLHHDPPLLILFKQAELLGSRMMVHDAYPIFFKRMKHSDIQFDQRLILPQRGRPR